MQILSNGKTRYRLTREEKEQLKFLGLQNFFSLISKNLACFLFKS